MMNAGISMKNAYSYLIEEVGEIENVGFDQKIYIYIAKVEIISAGDSQNLLNHLSVSI